MKAASIPDNEAARLRVLEEFGVLDTPPEQAYDDIVLLASQVCGTPIALLTLVDADRQWFKAKKGLEAAQTPRDQAFCAHAILDPDEVMLVPDAHEDDRFADNPLVTGSPNIRFYAGAPLVAPGGEALGTVSVIDRQPKDLDEKQIEALRALARRALALLERRQGDEALLRSELENARGHVRTLKAQLARQEQLREALRAEHSFRQAVIERAAEGVCVCHDIPTSPFVAFTVWNHRMTEITGYTMMEINRLGWYQTVYPDPEVRQRAIERMECMREGNDLRAERWEITSADGSQHVLAISTSRLTSADGLVHVLAMMHDVTEEEQLALEAALARKDGLTGVRARRAFMEDAGMLLKLAARSGGPSALAFLDVDDLKAVNDSNGHLEGDRLLGCIGAVLADSTRSTDIVGRIGGDEFAIFLPDTEAANARDFFDKLQLRLAEAIRDQVGQSGVSIGVSLFPAYPKREDDAYRFADSLMYEAKRKGKNRIVYGNFPGDREFFEAAS